MTATNVTAFMLSWAPYCFVSLAAVLTKDYVIADWEAEIPELLAKASVIYNPVIYTIMNSRFRATLFHILRIRRRPTSPEVMIATSRNQHNTRIATHRRHVNTELCDGVRHLQVPSTGRRVSINRTAASITCN